MAKNIPCNSSKVVTIEEYLDYISSKVDLRDAASLAGSAPMLKALANDRTVVVKELNRRLEASMSGNGIASAQTLSLGKGNGFYVRANIWPAISDMATGRAYQNQFAYNLAHDHNFSFLTVCYLGPGYDTELFEYDRKKIQGYVGEQVDLQFVEKIRFGSGSVMLYEESRDVHIQYPPQELTVTINLMVSPPDYRDQYHFDMTKRTIVSAMDVSALQRTSFIRIAATTGDAETFGLLRDLAKSHPCRRTRLATYEAVCQRNPGAAASLWEVAAGDPSSLVSELARKKLAGLGKR